jgi:hypothetical protein
VLRLREPTDRFRGRRNRAAELSQSSLAVSGGTVAGFVAAHCREVARRNWSGGPNAALSAVSSTSGPCAVGCDHGRVGYRRPRGSSARRKLGPRCAGGIRPVLQWRFLPLSRRCGSSKLILMCAGAGGVRLTELGEGIASGTMLVPHAES